MSEFPYCHQCGTKYEKFDWPRHCGACGDMRWKNPVPAVNVLLPVECGGLLVVKRGLEPSKGMWGLAGGYMDFDDKTWKHGGAREVWEELEIVVNPRDLTQFGELRSSKGDSKQRVLVVFALGPVIRKLPKFKASEEVLARGILPFGATMDLAFPAHTEIVAKYWAKCLPFRLDQSTSVQSGTNNTVITA